MRPSPEALDGSVVWSVIRAAHVLERELSALFAAFDLSPVQFGVVSYLAADGPMATADLARAVLVRPQSIAGVVDGLEKRELVARIGPRGRGRPSPVRLTPAGEELVSRMWPAFVQADQPGALGLKDEQSRWLVEAVRALLATKEPGLANNETTRGRAAPSGCQS